MVNVGKYTIHGCYGPLKANMAIAGKSKSFNSGGYRIHLHFMVGFSIPRHPGEHQSAIFSKPTVPPFTTTCAALALGRATCRAGKASTTKEGGR